MRCEGIGVIAVESLFGAFVRVFHQVGQGLNGVPGRVAGIFHGQCVVGDGRAPAAVEQFVEPERLTCLLAHVEWQRLGYQHAVRKHRNGHLFTIGIISRFCHDAVAHGRVEIERNLHRELYGSALAGGYGEILVGEYILEPAVYGFVGSSIQQFETGNACYFAVAQIHDLGAEFHLVSFPHETWRIGLNHQRFLGDGMLACIATGHILCMCQGHQFPFGQCLGDGKGEFNISFRVCSQVGEEECGFIEIFAYLDGAARLLLLLINI